MGTSYELLPAFQANMRRRGRKESTVAQHSKNLEPWLRFGGDREITTLTPSDFSQYLDWYETDFYERRNRPPSNNSRGNIISAVCQFFGWAYRQSLLGRDPTLSLRDDVPKREYRLHDWLPPDQERKVLAACRTPEEFRAMYLLRFAGPRASEAVALRWSDIEWNSGRLWINVKQSKTAAGVRRIPVTNELAPHLTRPGFPGFLNQADSWVFQTNTGQPWHRNFLGRVVARVGKRVGVDVTPHKLRRTLGYDLLNRTGNIVLVSKILGHANVQITQQAYAELLDNVLAEEFLRATA
jgi:integrase